MPQYNYPHGRILNIKASKKSHDYIIDEIVLKYNEWKLKSEALNSEIDNDLKEKVRILNDYKSFIENINQKHFKLQDKVSSSVIEEFLYYLFKDLPEIKSNLENELICMGMAGAYMDLSFAPKNFLDFIKNPGVYINKKNQDFTISKIVKCKFTTNNQDELAEFVVPAVAIECKTFIPSTMLGQSDYEAQKIKQGNPYSLYIIVAEQNALSDNVMLKNSKIDEIFILRKQKRNSAKNLITDKKPIDFEVVKSLYDYVKFYLREDWFNNAKATERGRLIN